MSEQEWKSRFYSLQEVVIKQAKDIEEWVAALNRTNTLLVLAVTALKRIGDNWADYELGERSWEAQIAQEALDKITTGPKPE